MTLHDDEVPDSTPKVRGLKGMLRGADVDEETYRRHLEEKLLPREEGQIGRFREGAGVSAKERSVSRTSGSAPSSPAGRRASECLDRLRERPPLLLDEGFGEDLLEVLEERPVEPIDSFEADVPITPEDRAAQWRIRDGATITSKQYLDWCSWITRDSVVSGRDFPKQPFELPDATTVEAKQELEEGKGRR